MTVFAHHGERQETRPTLEEVRQWPATVSIAQAWGYELANAGEFPCRILAVRGRKQVITASLIEVLEGT
jgi:hypothetical protein